jgi:hypothetical protein
VMMMMMMMMIMILIIIIIIYFKKQLYMSDNWSFIKPFQYGCNDFHMTCANCSKFICETSVTILL